MAELRASQPSLRDQIAWAIAGGAEKLGADRHRQRWVADKVGGLVDFIPGVGDAVAIDQAGRDWTAGDYVGAALEASTIFPGVGDIAGKAGKGLRARYSNALKDAVGWSKDINRIKITPERAEKAKEALAQSIDTWHRARAPGFFPETQQMTQAQEFARQMVRQGEDVRFRMPDGRGGSLYVRVGDKGTVRFADHPQPKEAGRIVGGFSKTLGRRHHPADYSVSPYERSLDEIMGLYGYGGGQ